MTLETAVGGVLEKEVDWWAFLLSQVITMLNRF